eukprot:5899338-Prymnesium_polylepis.3
MRAGFHRPGVVVARLAARMYKGGTNAHGSHRTYTPQKRDGAPRVLSESRYMAHLGSRVKRENLDGGPLNGLSGRRPIPVGMASVRLLLPVSIVVFVRVSHQHFWRLQHKTSRAVE